MKAANFNVFTQFHILFFNSKTLLPLNPTRFRFLTVAAALPSPETLEHQTEDLSSTCKDSEDLFRQWGCTEDDISKIFQRRPSLRKMKLKKLHSKLKILSDLGIPSSDLTKILNCRPRFLSCRINHCLDERLEFFQSLFGTKEILIKAIVRNPSMLTYDFHKQIKPTVAFYDQLGLSRSDLITMLLARPTLIPRSSLDDEKMDYIQRTGVEKGTTMYKHVITLFAISRSETIRQKVANLEKHGLTEDEVFRLFGRSPFLLTLSVDKVQRNMTFILGTMKLSANLVRDNPCLLFLNLETCIKPRYFLGEKLDDMGLVPRVKGPSLLRAMRMTEKRFIKAFINCHPEDVACELMEYYKSVKRVRRTWLTCHLVNILQVEVEFDNGNVYNLSAEYLRICSPAVDNEIRSVGGEKVISGRGHVGIMFAEPIRIMGLLFDDLHTIGIFTWDYLYHLGSNKLTLMRD